MPLPGATLANLLLLLDLPPHPGVGQVGLDGSPFLRALAKLSDRLIDLNSSRDRSGNWSLDIAITLGDSPSGVWGAIRRGGWLLELGDRKLGPGLQASVPMTGVAEVRHWLLAPDLALPHSIVPRTRMALRTHELASREAGWKRGLRLAAIARGWHPNDFGGEVRATRRN